MAPPPFDRERLRGQSRVIVVLYGLIAFGLFSGAFGQRPDDSFIACWSASYPSLQGGPVAAFDLALDDSARRLAVPASSKIYPWHCPPTCQLLILPLALLPFLTAYLSFIALSLIAYLAALRPLPGRPDATFPLLAFPGAFICFLHGQNSLLTAAAFANAFSTSTRRPLTAGVCSELSSYKPQLGHSILAALLAAGQWSAFVATALSVLGLAGAATAVFGFPLRRVFIQHTAMVRSVMKQDLVPCQKMPTAFVFLR